MGLPSQNTPAKSPESKNRDEQETAQLGVLVLLDVYGEVGEAKMLEAEELILRALELRDEAKAIFNRALRLAEGHCKKYPDPLPPKLPVYDPIDW